jgi:DNA-binding NtrC family response regulator
MAATIEGTILVVDDDEALLLMLQDLLETEGYMVKTATNGLEAFEQMAEERPALVLLDVNMPLLDGARFMQIFQARDIRLPVLIMSANQSTRQWAEAHGAVGFIPKPLDFTGLLSTIKRLVKA